MRCGLFTLVMAGIVVATSSPELTAQDRFSEVDLPFETAFGSDLLWPRPGSQMFWLDANRGYLYQFEETNIGAGLLYFRTTDGGSSWEPMDIPTPIPHWSIGDNFLLDPLATFSENDGESWQRFTGVYTDTNYFPDQDLRWSMTRAIAFDRQNIAVLYQLYDQDEGASDSVPFGPFRFAHSDDGGTSWTYVDSLKVFGSVLQELDSVTDFGRFPVPVGMTNVISNGWWQLVAMPTDSTALVATKVFGTIDGTRLNRFFLGALDLRNQTASWSPLPFSEPIFPPPATDLRLENLGDGNLWALQGSFTDIINDPEAVSWTIWQSSNNGASWDTIAAPDWVDYRSLRFLTPNNGIASNAVTFDGGRSWEVRVHPYESGGLFYAIDEATYYHANRYSFFASTTDSGITWNRNQGGGLPLDIFATGGHILAGRTYAGLLLGSDSGLTWRDLGIEGRLPARTHRVWTAGWPDRSFDSNRVVAIVTLRDRDASDRLVVLESNDGGEVWGIGQELDAFDPLAGGLDLQFVFDPEGEVRIPTGFLSGPDGLYVTENDGVTWDHVNGDLDIRALAMQNTEQGVAITPQGIFRTDNGGETFTLVEQRGAGQDVLVGLDDAQPDLVGALFTPLNSRNWSAEISRDLGNSFDETAGPNAPRTMNAGAFWGDTSNVHAVSRFGIIQHSADEARSFTLEVDSTDIFRASVGFVEAEADEEYIYLLGPGNRGARFYMYWSRPLSVSTGSDATEFATLRTNRSGDRLQVQFTLPARSAGSCRLIDARGTELAAEPFEAGATALIFETGDLPSGSYLLHVANDHKNATFRLAVVR